MLEEKLRELIKEKYGNLSNFCKATGMANSTLATILSNGINNATIKNIIIICKALEISADGLVYGEIVPIKKDDPVHEYARKLCSLNYDERSDAIQFIDFLLKKNELKKG